MASWIAAATSYSKSNTPMIPFYIYYSMFGFQRIGDLAWAAGDMRARGFLLGGTSGRTTLNGEGLQHRGRPQPHSLGHHPQLRRLRPDLRLRAGGDHPGRPGAHVWQRARTSIYYITLLNENYEHPAMPKARKRASSRACICSRRRPKARRRTSACNCSARGAILREVIAGAALLEKDFGVHADIWSVTSFTELKREADAASAGTCCIRWKNRAFPMSLNALGVSRRFAGDRLDRLHPRLSPSRSAAMCPARYKVLGTDGFGRSDYRRKLRSFFEVDRNFVAVAALKAMADAQLLPAKKVAEAIELYQIDPEKRDPMRS